MTQQPTRAGTVGAILRVTSGNFLEQFDFFLFGFYATYIARTFFPAESEFAALMLTFAVFGSGFLMRPIGAVVLGAYIDRIGRRKGLMVTLAIMGCGTLLIALVPGYQTIGVLAPILVLVGRLLQGFSAGVELGGVSVYLSEIATPGNKGFYTSWQSASQQVAIIMAALIGYALNATLEHEEIAAWGWRIPFFIGCLIIPLIFVLRRSLQETEEFLQRKHRPDTKEILTTIARNWRIITAGTLLVAMTTTTFYFITVYTPTYGRAVLHLSARDSLLVTMLVGISNFIWLPIGGAISDRIGRRPVLMGITVLALLTTWPVMHWLTAAPDFTRMTLVLLWFSFFFGMYNGAMVAALTEVMPVYVRTVGFSLAFSLATAIFGGLTPAISTVLVELTGDKSAPGWWLMCAALCGFIATALPSGLMGRIIAADLLPDLVAARFHRLIVAGAGSLDTLLVIQHPDALLVSKLLVLFILFQDIQYALAGFNLVRIAFRRINTGAIGIFQFGVFFRGRGRGAGHQSRCHYGNKQHFFHSRSPRGAAGSRPPRRHQKMVNGAITMNFTSRSSWKILP